MRERYAQILREGEHFYVGEDYCELLESAVVGLPDTTFTSDLFPTEAGFVLFARPLTLGSTQEEPDKVIQMSGLGWRRAIDGIQILNFGHAGDNWRYLPNTHFGVRDGDFLNEKIERFESEMDKGHGKYVSNDRHEMRYLMALLLFMNQKVLSRGTTRIDRSARRRAQAAGLAHTDTMQVVSLPKAEQAGGSSEPQAVEWSCRWIVRGFWRQQWYPSTQTRKPRWILPFMKGPEDKPLRVRERMHVLTK